MDAAYVRENTHPQNGLTPRKLNSEFTPEKWLVGRHLPFLLVFGNFSGANC